MREIKFRGYGKDVKQWVYGSLLDEKSVGIVAIQDDDCHVWEVDPESVGQYTGLKDADRREIYEGDIVKATLKEPSFVKRFKLQNEIVGEMLFDNAWWIKERETVNLIPPWRLRYYDLTVIGNVHDNPGLLETKNARD